jgi:hypothetical protein
MSLKTATLLAIIGAAVDLLLTTLGFIAHFITPLERVLYDGAGGVLLSALYTFGSATFLLFFITLYSNQK